MTSDGVDGTAAARRSPVRLPGPTFGSGFIKCDDGRLGAYYTEPEHPHTPAGPSPDSPRRERQVASALRICTDTPIRSLTRGASGDPGRAGGGIWVEAAR